MPFSFAFSENVHDLKENPAHVSAGPDQPGNAGSSGAAEASSDSQKPGVALPQRVRVSAGVTQGLLIHKVQPVYPTEARRQGIQGAVLLQAVINKEGRVENLQLISGQKELADAAIAAVQQWRYRPFLFKGQPVAVEAPIQVNFALSGR